MKKSFLVLGIAVVIAFGVAARLSSRSEEGLQRPSDVKQAATRITREFEIAAGAVQSVAFVAPSISGTLSGEWRSSGKGGNDTLSGFTLADPSDVVLDSSFKGSSSGSFTVKVSAAGTHTFLFENAGKKQMPRHVTLEAEFTPDRRP